MLFYKPTHRLASRAPQRIIGHGGFALPREPSRAALRAGYLGSVPPDRRLRPPALGSCAPALAVLRAVVLTVKSTLAFARSGLPRLRDWGRQAILRAL